MPKVSVLMSNYNTPVEFLKKSLDSVLSQSFTDFEIVIINDGSVDESRDVLYDYARKDSQIIVIENEHNLGLPCSLNKGIDACRGEYIARMDTDDICYPDRLEKQVAFMDAHPEYICSGAWAETFNVDEDTVDKVWQPIMCDYEEYKIRLLFGSAPLIIHPTAIFRKEMLKINNLKYPEDPKYKYSEDYKMWVQCSKFGEFGILEEVVLKYRNADSDSRITIRHKQEMEQCVFEVQFDQLKDLGIELSKEYFEINNYLLLGRKPYDIRYKRWINMILKQNKIKKVYSHDFLKSILHERWYNIVYYGIAYEKSVFKRVRFFITLYPDGKCRFIKRIIMKKS